MTMFPAPHPVGEPDWEGPERRFRSEQLGLLEQFDPRRVPLLSRSHTTDTLAPIVEEMRASDRGGLLSVVAEAGSGKTVLLGHLFQLLRADGDAGGHLPEARPPAILVRCDQVSLPDEPPASHAARPGDLPLPTASLDLLDHAFGEAAGAGLLTAAIQQYAGKRPVLLLDTLDLLLSPRWSRPLTSYLAHLVDLGITVVLTCRPRDYEDHANGLIPAVQGNGRMAVLKEVPPLDQDEIVAFTRQFLAHRGIPPAVGEEEFGERLVTLSAGGPHVRLRRLLSSPLLLAMVCEVFGETGGHVPQDLTTSGLYARYWEEKVSRTRRLTGEASDQRIEDKERLCRRMASFLWGASRSRFHDRMPATKLTAGSTGTGPGQLRAALRELCDDGFLTIVERGQVVEFRHQTLAEYAVAQWLVEVDTERRDFYQELHDHPRERGFALPVLRHLIGMEDALHQLDDVFPLLPLDDLGVFRNAAFALANCGSERYLTELAAKATSAADERLRSLWEALETVAGLALPAARSIALTALRELPHAQTPRAGALYGLLVVRRDLGEESADLAPGVRAVHERRADWPPADGAVQQPDEVLQLMLGPALAVGVPISTATLGAVMDDFARAGRKTQEAYVRLFLTVGTFAAHTATFLHFLWALPPEVPVPGDIGAEFVVGATLGMGTDPAAFLDALVTDGEGFPRDPLAQQAAFLLVSDRPGLRDRLWPHLHATGDATPAQKRAASVLADLCADPAVASETYARLIRMDLGQDGSPVNRVEPRDGTGRSVLYGLGRRILPAITLPEERAELERWLARISPPPRRRGTDKERGPGSSRGRDSIRDLPLDELVRLAANEAHDVTARQAAGRLGPASEQGALLSGDQWRRLLASGRSSTRRAAVTMLDTLLRSQDARAGVVAPALLTCSGADATPGERQVLYTAFDSWLRGYPEAADAHRLPLQELLRDAAEARHIAGEPAKAWVALVRTCFESALRSPERQRTDEARAVLGVYGAGAASDALPARGSAASFGVALLVRAVNHGITTPEALAANASSWRAGGQCAAVHAVAQTADGGAWSPLLQELLDDGALCPDAEAELVRLREAD
ncbi:hypothetical protein [Streptomyces exfoliatus]|uniref:hypothetical protein n=1 Tax=Streptomyces exfoliatus TaxID=1905 RepID=UPI00378C8750